MLRLSEEQRAILGCYSGTKEEVTAELRKAIPFIEDVELRELSEELIKQIGKMKEELFEETLQSVDGEAAIELLE